MDLIITIIMTNICGYNSLRKWLAQNQTSPGAQEYPTKANELVEMMNSGLFEPGPFKLKDCRRVMCDKKKKEDKGTVKAIIESSPNDIAPVELDLAEGEVPDNDILL